MAAAIPPSPKPLTQPSNPTLPANLTPSYSNTYAQVESDLARPFVCDCFPWPLRSMETVGSVRARVSWVSAGY